MSANSIPNQTRFLNLLDYASQSGSSRHSIVNSYDENQTRTLIGRALAASGSDSLNWGPQSKDNTIVKHSFPFALDALADDAGSAFETMAKSFEAMLGSKNILVKKAAHASLTKLRNLLGDKLTTLTDSVSRFSQVLNRKDTSIIPTRLTESEPEELTELIARYQKKRLQGPVVNKRDVEIAALSAFDSLDIKSSRFKLEKKLDIPELEAWGPRIDEYLVGRIKGFKLNDKKHETYLVIEDDAQNIHHIRLNPANLFDLQQLEVEKNDDETKLTYSLPKKSLDQDKDKIISFSISKLTD